MSLKLLEDYMETEELAAELGVTARTIYRWHSLGYGPPKTKVGNKMLYHAQAVREWLKSRESQPVR